MPENDLRVVAIKGRREDLSIFPLNGKNSVNYCYYYDVGAIS